MMHFKQAKYSLVMITTVRNIDILRNQNNLS